MADVRGPAAHGDGAADGQGGPGQSGLVQIPVEVAADAVLFSVVHRGYARRQVDAHVARLEQELAELRWLHDELAAERDALDAQREEQDRWVPSFTALGRRVAEILRLADEEADALRTEAVRDSRRLEREAAAALTQFRAEQETALARARQAAESELRTVAAATDSRRQLLESELVRARRDAELEITGMLASANARAQDVLAEAAREADELRATARAELLHLQRRRDELAADLVDLSARLVAAVHRLDRTDAPLEVHTG